jgi:hypothetical protein
MGRQLVVSNSMSLSSSHADRGGLYQVGTYALLLPTSLLFLRLYLLPRSQSLPPRHPPDTIKRHQTIFECLSPDEVKLIRIAAHKAGDQTSYQDGDEVVVNRCYKGKCQGRWKPARARHCSECGVCRAGFDHHCAFVSRLFAELHRPTRWLISSLQTA